MSPRYIGINPNEVVWKSLAISWWQRVVRRFAVLGFITALIVFWAIPVAFVGLISNITYLETFSWLSWLEKIPQKIMGIISGLLPAVMLSVLMSLVPVIMRCKYFYTTCTKMAYTKQYAPSFQASLHCLVLNSSLKTRTSFSRSYKSSLLSPLPRPPRQL